MKHTYHIHGMTCNVCRVHVEKILYKVKGVSAVAVNLENGEAIIEMQSYILIETFQEALKKDDVRYSIHNQGENHHHSEPKSEGSGTFYCPMHCEGDKTYFSPLYST